MPPIRLAVHGAAGRMGQRVVALACQDADFTVTVALEGPGHPAIGADAGTLAGAGELGVHVAAALEDEVQPGTDAPPEADVMIDFSTPEAAVRVAETCAAWKIPLVLATTGLDESQQAEVLANAHHIPLLLAPNMSLAVNLLMKLSAVAAAACKDHPAGVDVEIIDRHHRFKEDAPSGTALKFGEIIAEVMGQTDHVHGRQGRPLHRKKTEIGYHALRVGDNPGEHTIVFGFLGEMIEMTVRATNRDCYAHGALLAAKNLIDKGPGIYSINEALGLE
ncbi:MAG: 4-hydroxy-tetrahydrodipicolinate reductase [Planctomycetales bacterium]